MIKEDVYEPDWRTPERREYTKQVADILADIGARRYQPVDSERAARLQAERHRAATSSTATPTTSSTSSRIWSSSKKKTGKTVTLGLEPEPRCYLETTDETITYFKNYLFSGETAKQLAKQTGLNEADADTGDARATLGVVFDIGHQAVGYEDIPASLQKLVDAGVPIVKLQEAASMHIPDVTQKTVDALQSFAKTIYLSQTCQLKDGKHDLVPQPRGRVRGVPERSRAHASGARTSMCRCSSPTWATDSARRASALEQALAVHKKTPLSTHLEIETYTWDVLPDHLKTGDIVEYVTRELEWVKGQLV